MTTRQILVTIKTMDDMFPSLPLLLPLFVHYIIEKEEERESKATNQLIVMGWILALRIVVLRHASSKTNCSGQDTPAYSVKNMCTYTLLCTIYAAKYSSASVSGYRRVFFTQNLHPKIDPTCCHIHNTPLTSNGCLSFSFAVIH